MPWAPSSDLRGRVVLVHPIASGAGRRLTDTGFLIPPLGLMYLSAQLKRHAVPVILVNEEVDGEALPQLLRTSAATGPLLLGIYVNHSNEERVLRLLEAVRDQTEIKVVVGGPAAIDPERFLQAGARAACVGEGDQAILDLAAWASGQRDLEGIPGLAVGARPGVVHTAPRPLLEDLDALPLPDWDFYPPDRVPFDNLYPPVVRPFATLMTSRGCPMRCTYCASPTIWRHKVRRRSVESVMAEVDLLVGRFGVRFLDVYDDVFNLGRDWTVRFCESLIRRGTPVRWSAYFYPVGFDAEILGLAKAAGLRVFKVGVQTGSPRILENIGRRPSTLEQARLYLREATRLGLFTAVDFIFGLPGENHETLQESARYIKTIEADSLKIGQLRVLPGSPLHSQGIHPAAEVGDAEVGAAMRRALLGYYLRPRRLMRTVYWSTQRGLSWGRVKSIAKLTRLAMANQVFPGELSVVKVGEDEASTVQVGSSRPNR